jgi:hypothetical protein
MQAVTSLKNKRQKRLSIPFQRKVNFPLPVDVSIVQFQQKIIPLEILHFQRLCAIILLSVHYPIE